MPERTLSARTAFVGRIFDVEQLEVEIDPGVTARRDIVRHPGAIAAICRHPDGRFLFVRQYRKPLERDLFEVVAGGLGKGEAPEHCAVREIREETGYAVTRLRKLGVICSTPGFTDEVLHVFLADLAAAPGQQETEHDERITVEFRTQAEFENEIARGGIMDAKTLASWLLFHRCPAAPPPAGP